ncbi:Dolichol kinase sec59 [Hyphodiscus hymeniophilus]|uniref:dolichol kinase n=1 Tax=Hyphodiscus hymeniophilus TaxID=353542 RepID=A0A9P6SK32_9HELO|nr:Dolichol kinase sec59 [Hyphodiscus hymeniophilus]
MPESLRPAHPPSHAKSLRDDSVRRLSRSPHPYHRQQFEIPHASERFITNAPPTQSPLRSAHNTDDEEQEISRLASEGYREPANSDSGTEADDEHFLKGLPAPKLRPHKGLRGAEGAWSSTPSPLLSPAILDGDIQKIPTDPRWMTKPTALKEEDIRKAAERYRHKRRVEIARRATEATILVFVGAILGLNRDVRQVLKLWKRELICQSIITTSLIAIYPIRILRCIEPTRRWKKPFPLSIPAAFDPAPLLYPPAITMLVSMLLFIDRPASFLPSIILAISSLPKQLVPAIGGLEGCNILHWALACLPLLLSNLAVPSRTFENHNVISTQFGPEILVLLQPLHETLCNTLHSLTTTSLLPAELQLFSVGLIELLLLAQSPQAIILKSMLWGGGIGILVSCSHVLRWGVALARVPRWRFRRPEPSRFFSQRGLKVSQTPVSFAKLGNSLFARDAFVTNSSEEDELDELTYQSTAPDLGLSTKGIDRRMEISLENGSISAIERPTIHQFPQMSGPTANGDHSITRRRNTLPILTSVYPKSSKRTPSGRKKRSTSTSTQSFFALTQTQATIRKWLYATYVYVCVLTIILIGIRAYVGKYALQGEEPVGWALGYLFGDLPRFRMEVVIGNLQQWICLPVRSGLENEESCHLGWVEHLRHSSFGEANTRLILCGYWLCIIIVGLAVVFRLSAVYEVDTRRKVFHFMMVAMLLPATYVDPTFAALALGLMLAIFLLLDLFRASQLPPLSKSLAYFLTPYVDGRDLKGPVVISHIFLLIGCAIPLWLSLGYLPRTGSGYFCGWEVPRREVSMVSGVICVGMGDAAASLIGRRYGRHKWIWGGGKSIEGSIAFATAVGLALILAKAWLRIGGWPANNEDSWLLTTGKAGVAAGVASLTEAVLTGGNDNVVVPVVLWLCAKGLEI